MSRDRAPDSLRHHPPQHPRQRMASGRARLHPAGQGVEHVPRRPLPRATHHQGRNHSSRTGAGQRAIPVGDAGPGSAPRYLFAHLRRRSGARRRRHVLRARRQPANPSGVSYMLEDRKMMMRLFPELFAAQRIAPIDHYPNLLLDTLKSSSPIDNPSVVVLTPDGSTARSSNMHSWHGKWVWNWWKARICSCVTTRSTCATTDGPKAVDVIYRRLDDAFLDPLAFNPDSMLGVPGLLSSYRSGNVVLANAIGTGAGGRQIGVSVRHRHDPLSLPG